MMMTTFIYFCIFLFSVVCRLISYGLNSQRNQQELTNMSY